MTDIKVYEIGENILPSLKHYSVSVGYVAVKESDEDMLGYVVVNEHTGVTEDQFMIMPDAIAFAKGLEEWYENFLREESPLDLPPEQKIITH